jgi:serine/threonine-protein kinase
MALLANLHHPNIITVHDAGEHAGRPFFVMEYVTGGSFAEARLPREAALDLLETVARACHFAHGRGVVHRDLKPANILVSDRRAVRTQNERRTSTARPVSSGSLVAGEEDAGPPVWPVVVDFGLAKILVESGSTTTGTVGTPAYLAPEQVLGKEIDERTDVYQLGVMLYEVLTGRLPHERLTLVTLKRKCVEAPPRPRSIQKSITPELERVVLRALSVNQEGRHPTALDLALDLRAARAQA